MMQLSSGHVQIFLFFLIQCLVHVVHFLIIFFCVKDVRVCICRLVVNQLTTCIVLSFLYWTEEYVEAVSYRETDSKDVKIFMSLNRMLTNDINTQDCSDVLVCSYLSVTIRQLDFIARGCCYDTVSFSSCFCWPYTLYVCQFFIL